MKTKLILLFAMMLLLAACAPGGVPQLIGSAPRAGEGGLPPINTAPPAPAGLVIVYNASIELAVRNVAYAREWVKGLASEMNGYVLAERAWQSGFEQLAEVTLAVPAHRVEQTLSRLRYFGNVRTESKTGQLLTTDTYDAGSGYSTVTVTLRPDWGVGVWDFLGGVLWLSAALIPPLLMLIGLITVLRAVGRWWRKRRVGTTAPNVEQRMAEVVNG
ncbi:MAG: DUF4349 domain-containing protein [Anaerolineales bacterium]